MSYKSVREILNAVFDSSDSSLKTIYKTDGEVLNMVLDESGDPALKVSINTLETPTGLLEKLKNVDGTGSGLDADMLDGMNTAQSGVSFIPYADSSGNVGIGVAPTAKLHVSAGDTSSTVVDGDTVYKSAILTATAGGRSVGIGSSAGGQANYIGSLDSGHPLNLFVYNDVAEVFQTALSIGNDGIVSVKRSDGAALAPITEHGSNANGEYTKFADGTMICARRIITTNTIDVGYWGGYRSVDLTWTFPAEFSGSNISVAASTINGFSVAMRSVPTSTSVLYAYTSIVTVVSQTREALMFAIGRWY